jgi:mRNA interferase MazF
MRRGEIRWYRFSSPDKKRPVLLLTRDSVLEYLGEVTIAPITTTVRDIPSEVLLTAEDGMPRTCAVNLDHLQTVTKDKLGPVITVLPASRMDEVRSALMFALGFGGEARFRPGHQNTT